MKKIMLVPVMAIVFLAGILLAAFASPSGSKFNEAFGYLGPGVIIVILAGGFFLISNLGKLKAQNHELAGVKEDLRLLLDSTGEAIYGVDLHGNCTFCNKSCLNILGYEHQDQLLGENMHEKIHYQRADGTPLSPDECQICLAFEKGEGTHVEDEVVWKADGTSFPAAYFSYPQLRKGKVVGGVVTFVDITERKQAQERILTANELLENANQRLRDKQYELEEQNSLIEELNAQLEEENERHREQKEILQAIIDSLGSGIIMLDETGGIAFINQAWKDIFAYIDFKCTCDLDGSFYINGSTCLNTSLFFQNMMAGMEDHEAINNNLNSLTRDSTSKYNIDLEQTSPVKRFLNLYSNPCISNVGHHFGRVFVVRDISHQKELDRLKLELMSTVSHELRTPMSSILGFSELLLTRDLPTERQREYLGIINSEAKRLTDLINDFLDIQRMESGKLVFNKQYHSVVFIIEEALKLFENITGKHNIVYVDHGVDIPKVYCDRDKILQLLSNLLSNAIKYSPAGGEIKIDLSLEKDTVQVGITDHGLGIPGDVEDKIFDKFFRIDSTNRHQIGGTGLGLAICKEIVSAHGGKIGFDSIHGQGSRFYFNIPLSNIMPGSTETSLEDRDLNAICDGRLLIVEDDIVMVKLIKEILENECLEMHSTASGEEAVSMAKENDYRLFILDVVLKGRMNGWDVVKELKKDAVTAQTPIIISSIYENKKDISCQYISDYLVKPFEPEQMIQMVRKALDGKHDSKMMVNGDERLKEEILDILHSKGIVVKNIECAGNMLIITLNGEEGLLNG